MPQKYKLLFSKGTPWVEKKLHAYAKNVSKKEALFVSKKLYKEILEVNKQIVEFGLPPHLQLCYVNAKVHTGVFLKYDSAPISTGDLIGIYTGRYELVPGDLSSHNSYAYDVAQGMSLKTKELQYVDRSEDPLDAKQDYSVQTNALEEGNFTRFINHSSLHPNIEAIVSKLPDGRMEVILFALKDIEPGQRLLSNYGGEYWKALGIIPDDMTPDTYLLDNPYKPHKVHPIKPFSPSFKEKLLTVRNAAVAVPDNVERSSVFNAFIESLPPVASKKHQDRIEEWENIISERGLPREYTCERNRICINKTVKKGEFVGAISGTLSFEEKENSILLYETSRRSLFLHPDEAGNCLQWVDRDCIRGNIKLYPLYNEETGEIYLVLLATKRLSPGEELILNT